MDDARFDAWTRSFASRRGAMRALVGIGAALAMPQIASAGRPVCDAPGSKCDPDAPFTCCSADCKKHKRKKHKAKYRCAPAGKPFGCTKQDDFCRTPNPVGCPESATGVCIKGKSREPLCVLTYVCTACKRDSDCTEAFGAIARCVKGCANCKAQPAGVNTACVVPVVGPPG